MGNVVLLGFYVCLFFAALFLTFGFLEWQDTRRRR